MASNIAAQIQELLAPFSKQLQDAGYVPIRPSIDWIQPMPMSNKDKQIFGSQPVGIPDDWDYKTAQFDPSGKPLPVGAKGWTPQGEAYYGGQSTFSNWLSGVAARWNAPIKPGGARGPFEKGAEYSKQFADSLLSGKFGEAFASAIGAVQSVGDMLANLGGEVEGEPSPITGAGRVVTEAVSGTLALVQEPAQQIKQVRGGLQAAGEAIGLGESITSKWIKDIPGNGWWESFLY